VEVVQVVITILQVFQELQTPVVVEVVQVPSVLG